MIIRTVTDQDLMKTRSRKNKNKSKNSSVRRWTGPSSESFLSGYPFPQKLWMQMACYTTGSIGDASLSTKGKVYRPTSLFDIDDDAGGPSYSGYTFFAAGYSRYRVIGYEWEVTFANALSDAVSVGVYPIPSNSSPSELGSSANPEIAAENLYGKQALLGSLDGQPAVKLRGYVSCEKVWGTPEAKYASAWAGNSGDSPTSNTWLMLCAHRVSGNALSTTGVQYTMRVIAHGYWDQKILEFD